MHIIIVMLLALGYGHDQGRGKVNMKWARNNIKDL
jgi:hypothetical protein